MAINFCYEIRPKPGLIQLVAKYPGSDLHEPLKWLKREDISPHGLYTVDEYIAQVKLIAVAYMKMQLFASPKYRNLQQRIFGKPPFGIDIFDTWWTVNRLTGAHVSATRFTEIMTLVDVETLKVLAKTYTEGVDQWIEMLTILKMKTPQFSFDLFNDFV